MCSDLFLCFFEETVKNKAKFEDLLRLDMLMCQPFILRTLGQFKCMYPALYVHSEHLTSKLFYDVIFTKYLRKYWYFVININEHIFRRPATGPDINSTHSTNGRSDYDHRLAYDWFSPHIHLSKYLAHLSQDVFQTFWHYNWHFFHMKK